MSSSVPGVIKPLIHKLEQNLEQLYKPFRRDVTQERFNAKILETQGFFFSFYKVIKLCHKRDRVM